MGRAFDLRSRLLVFFSLVVGTALAAQDCPDDEVCFFDVPGAQCADGTPTGFSITYRKDAKKLLIFLEGGGACWSEATCRQKAAKHLSAYGKYEGPFQSPLNPLVGTWADLNDPKAIFSKGYHIVRIPYCTGDVFGGDAIQKYESIPFVPYVVRHVGYRNLEKILPEVQKRISDPEQVVFYGASAGGIGVSWNVHQVARLYPKTELMVVNDGGLLFKSPTIAESKIDEVCSAWGASSSSPVALKAGAPSPFTEVLTYHQKQFPKVKYAYMSTYNDKMMTGFAALLKASSIPLAVRNIMISLADGELAGSSDYKVFYAHGTQHVFFDKDPQSISSQGVTAAKWVQYMLEGDPAWKNIRPDKSP